MTRNRFWNCLILAAVMSSFFAFIAYPARASDTLTPSESAESIRKALFAAQTALMGDDTQVAAAKVKAAQTLYMDVLAQPLQAAAPDVDRAVQAGFAQMAGAISANDNIALAAARAQLWTRLLDGATTLTLQAIQANDSATARQWLNVREYRSANRFSLPAADATLAVTGLGEGKIAPDAAFATVRRDLLDTYQSRLNVALADTDTAVRKEYHIKAAETASLAGGYFDILGAVYREQRGAEAFQKAQAVFADYLKAATTDTANYPAAVTAVNGVLKGFRAAPLTQAELERRTGQLLRYVSLVDVEYARGVRDGKIVKDLEVQEAITFREGAVAAFIDLRPSLEARDAVRTAKVGAMLDDLKTNIDAVANPEVITELVGKIGEELGQLLPQEWVRNASNADFDVIFSVLDQIEPAVRQEQYQLAENARIEAYAILDTGIEKKLQGFAPELSARIEGGFWAGEPGKPGLATLIANRASAAEIRVALARLREAMREGQTVIASFKSAPGAVVGNAAVIVFREGLEAVLILASLIASLRTAQTKKYRRPIFIGGLLALFASGLTWVVANSILMALARYGEKLEAVVGIIAIGVLLLITNWFFHKTYWTGWMANFHQRKNEIISGTMAFGTFMALITLGFTSIYREGFETVLFLQSLVLETSVSIVIQGVVIGLLATFAVGAITFTLQAKLPYKKMLIITGIFIAVVLVSMVGKTVFAMQAVGWLPITPITGVWFPYWVGQWFGLYATWQGIILQIASAVFVIGSYFLAEYQNKAKRDAKIAARAAGGAANPANNPTTTHPA
jgi:high-affinity iron transporter